jgi:hypothetical protein
VRCRYHAEFGRHELRLALDANLSQATARAFGVHHRRSHDPKKILGGKTYVFAAYEGFRFPQVATRSNVRLSNRMRSRRV